MKRSVTMKMRMMTLTMNTSVETWHYMTQLLMAPMRSSL